MEGLIGATALVVAIAAVAVAATALFLVVRAERSSASDSMGGARTAALERRQTQLVQRLESIERDIDAARGQTGGELRPVPTEGRSIGALGSKVGLVRFDAFEDTGGGQSFALALINDDGDGVVLTNLHSRQSSRLYVKDIRRGIADAPLSTEEERALRSAGVELEDV